jgi:ribosome-associated heat shock protein Hsp15
MQRSLISVRAERAAPGRESPDAVAPERQRIDKWLWHARVVRTRESAAALTTAGHVQVNGAKVRAAAAPVRCGDVVTVALDQSVRVMRVCGFASRRGGAEEARRLFEDLA